MRLKKKYKIMGIILLVFLITFILGISIYQYELSAIDKNNKDAIEFEIEEGTSTSMIASNLEEEGLIKSAFFFKVYVKLHNINSLKASTYTLSKNMSVKKIVDLFVGGNSYNKNVIRLTFHEGKTIEDYAKMLEEKTSITSSSFLEKMKDTTYLNTLISNYWFLTDSILNPDIYYGLEGYLAPDTYEVKDKDVTIEEIITMLLDQEEVNLEPYKQELQTLGVHSSLTLASMAELEGIKLEDRKKIVGVFQNRLKNGMNLGSDVTTYYAFHQQMTGDLTAEMFNTYNPYNTRSSKMAGQLPVGPICNPGKDSVDAAVHSSNIDALFFVADKNGAIYYNKTQSEHDRTIQEIKARGDWIW